MLALPFYLNDFASMYLVDWRAWLAIDYVFVKALPLAIAGWLLWRGRVTAGDIGLDRVRWPSALAAFAVALAAGVLLDQNAYGWLDGMPGYAMLGSMPAIGNPAIDWFDLTVGLLLVGVVEELVFRAWLAGTLERLGAGRALVVAASAIAFGLIHWSAGLHAVLVTGAIGAVFMLLYLLSRSLPALALAHFLVNFIDFAGVIDKTMFRFG